MKKNVKILGAAAAALLAVAPVVASATTVNADFHIQPGTTTTSNSDVPLSLDISMNATGGLTTAADAASSVKISSGIGTVNLTKDSKVSITDASGTPLPDTSTATALSSGTEYRVQITNVSINGLTNNVKYDLGQATFQQNGSEDDPTSTPTGSQLVGPGTLISAPFHLVKTGDTTQPYFTDLQLGEQLSSGAVAYAGTNGAGLTIYGNRTAKNLLDIAKHFTPVVNGSVITTESDVESQLAEQGLTKNADGIYNIPAGGFNITLTARNDDSDKTATVVVPFAGRVDKAGFPVITTNADYSKDFSNSDFSTGEDFSNVASQGGQNIAASKLIRNVEVGAEFGYSQALAPFTAKTYDGRTNLDMAVLSNPVNTKVPGRYTVTVQATDWSTGKTSRLSYTVQVGDADATYQTINYPAAYGINTWAIAGNTVSWTGKRVAGQSQVATYDTRTVNGTSYTRINGADSNTWVPTSFLGNHSSNTNKPSNNNGEKAISGVARVTYNGKGAVKLLNADGRHVDQYVQKGSSWKVWAEKTVNGVHMYRIGNQSQWVPAMYVTLN